MSLTLHQIPMFTDNYGYVLRNEALNWTAAVDPGEPAPIQKFLQQKRWKLDAILNTHHHPDHIGGNATLKSVYHCAIYAYAEEPRIPLADHFVEDGQTLSLGGEEVQVLFTPGHTLGHICYYFPQSARLFCGDTLFSFGCGRLFEGTPEMMLSSLTKIRNLPPNTQICCAHEYTLTNIEFALSLEPEKSQLKSIRNGTEGKRQQNVPTVPSILQQEIQLNPLLRWDDPTLRKALHLEDASDVEVFAQIRRLRDQW